MATVAAKFFHFSKSSDKNRKSNQRTHSKTHEQCLFKNCTTRHVCKPHNANGCRPTTTSHKICMMLIGRKNTAAVRQPLTDLTTEPLYQSEPSGKAMPGWSSQCPGRESEGEEGLGAPTALSRAGTKEHEYRPGNIHKPENSREQTTILLTSHKIRSSMKLKTKPNSPETNHLILKVWENFT